MTAARRETAEPGQQAEIGGREQHVVVTPAASARIDRIEDGE
jgi:hypothetical protein